MCTVEQAGTAAQNIESADARLSGGAAINSSAWAPLHERDLDAFGETRAGHGEPAGEPRRPFLTQ
jgi:hypothetical protein